MALNAKWCFTCKYLLQLFLCAISLHRAPIYVKCEWFWLKLYGLDISRVDLIKLLLTAVKIVWVLHLQAKWLVLGLLSFIRDSLIHVLELLEFPKFQHELFHDLLNLRWLWAIWFMLPTPADLITDEWH